jgi:DNA-binding NtrC family response regulator
MKHPLLSTTSSGATRIVTRTDQSVVLQLKQSLLKVIKGPDKGKSIEIEPRGLVVGTAPECDLVLTDPSVSRSHFELIPGERGYQLRDLASRNGTRIAGMQVLLAMLAGGEQIFIGHTRLRLIVLDKHREYPLSSKTTFGSLLGRSAIMRQVFASLEQAAKEDMNVLIEGESGTGKDLAAEVIHLNSSRAANPYIVVDCGSIQSSLIESELFGHQRGAFTGADRDRVGAIEAAHGGTVFLDEIGELSLETQTKLLRLLERREVKRIGENEYRPIDVRIIAATNRHLQREVAAERFRKDLFYRLSVLYLRMPPLREHREDIGLIAKSFVQKMRPDLDPLDVISDQVLAMLVNHLWPGNVRELRNVVQRLLLFPNSPQSAIEQLEHIDPEVLDEMRLPFHDARRKWNERFEKAYLMNSLDKSEGVVSRAAQVAEIPRQTFHRLMKKYGLLKQ